MFTVPNKDRKVSKCVFEDSVSESDSFGKPGQQPNGSKVKLFKELWKTNLSGMVAMTAYVGRGLVPNTEVPILMKILPENGSLVYNTVRQLLPGVLFFTGTFLLSGASITINQIMERERDKLMIRTQKRPLPTQRISVIGASASAVVVGLSGAGLLYISSNTLTTALGVANLLIYTTMYTPLKTRHWLNTWFGAIVGAIPPVMGCTSVSTDLPALAPSLVWGGILALWQIPHFMALSIMCKKDYSRAGYHMLGLQNPQSAGIAALTHTAAMLPLCVAAPYYGVTNWLFAPAAAFSTVSLTRKAMRFYQDPSATNARRLFFSSLFYLGAVSGALLLTSKQVGLGQAALGVIKRML